MKTNSIASLAIAASLSLLGTMANAQEKVLNLYSVRPLFLQFD